MSVWNKVLLVLIFLCAAGFVYFGADALKMRRDSQKKLEEARKSLEAEQKKNRDFLFGTGQEDGYIFLVNEVNHLRMFRGTRAWPNCLPLAQAVVKGSAVTLQLQVDAIPEQPGSQPSDDLTVADDQNTTPSPAGATPPSAAPVLDTLPQERILPGTIVYLFDKRPVADGGCLLGEFSVAKVDKNNATLTNAYPMTADEIKRIDDSVGRGAPWAVYTVLPREAPKTTIAGNTVPVPDVNAATEEADDSEDFQAQASPQPTPDTLADPADDPRPMLAQTFTSLNQRRIQLLNLIEMQEMQMASLKTTEAGAGKMIEFYTQEKENTQAQHQESQRQYKEVKKLYDATTEEITNIDKLIASLKSLNKKMLADLTQAQLRSSEIILDRNASLTMSK